MELLYIWIDKFLNINNCGFHLSGRLTVQQEIRKVDRLVNLSITANENYMPGLFSKNIADIIGIVGANGVGKSNFLECLKSFVAHLQIDGTDWIAIFLETGTKNLRIVYSLSGVTFVINNGGRSVEKWQVSVRNTSGYTIIQNEIVGKNNFDYFADLIFYAPMLDLKGYPESKNFEPNYADVSTNYLIHFDGREEDDQRDKVEIHRYRNVERQYVFVRENPKFVQQINFPTEIEIRFVKVIANDAIRKDDLGYNTKEFYKKFRESATSKWNSIPNRTIREGRDANSKEAIIAGRKLKTKWWFAINLLTNYLYNFSYKVDLNDSYFKVGSQLKEFNFKNDDPVELVRQYFQRQTFVDKTTFDFDAFIDLVTRTIDEKADVYYSNEDNESWFYVDATSGLDILRMHERYLMIFTGESSHRGFLDLNWRDISSGEKSFLDLFSRVYWAMKDLLTPGPQRMIYLLLDEGEMGFHPNWQRNYIHYLIEFLQLFEAYTFHIILTTHSPFIVSDLPLENLILLSKGSEGTPLVQKKLNTVSETFGANIHTLLSDTFFMDQGLMGEFAKNKITEYFAMVPEMINNDKAGYKKMVNITGEPLIKMKLMDMYVKKLGSAYEEEQLQDQINLLNKKLDNLRKNRP